MNHDSANDLRLTPPDPEAPKRMQRLRELGLGDAPDIEFDEFAQRMAQLTATPFAVVNFLGENRQYYAGLYTAVGGRGGASRPAGAEVDRAVDREHGFCPHVVARRKALVLDDVCDYPRFAGNPVVDEAGVRSYLGAPLIDRTGTTLGTICVVDTEPRPWGRAGLETIKSLAAEVVDRIHQREANFG